MAAKYYPEVGDIFYSLRGGEQSNYGFFEVIEVSEEDVVLREIAFEILGRIVPCGEMRTAKPIRRITTSEEALRLLANQRQKLHPQRVITRAKKVYPSTRPR